MRVRRWLGVMLVAMILAGCGASTGGKLGSGTGGPTPTPTATPTPPTTTTPSPTAAPTGATMQSFGWTKASLKYPDLVAAAPSDPNTLYSCAGSFTATFIAFSVSYGFRGWCCKMTV
jgi:hypothetical protein